VTTAQAFPTYSVPAQGDQGVMRGGVTYFNQHQPEMRAGINFNQPQPEMRGGVTYFDPTAQNLLLQQQMYQRQTVAIPIVDPSIQSNIAMRDLSNL